MVIKFCKKILFFFWDSLLGLFGGAKKAYVLVKPFARIREAFRKRYNVGYVPRDAYLHYTTSTKDAGPERSGKKESLGGSSRGKSYIYGGIGLLVILVAIGAAWMLNRKGSTKPPQGENHPAPKQLNFEIAPNKAPFFVGRKKEMDALAPDLNKKTDKLVVLPPITGVGGSGKTALVLELIEKYATKYNYIAWIDAFTAEDIEASYRQIAKDIGLSNGAASSVHHELKGKRVLYVFDNAPDLKTIQPYLNLNLKEGHVLITSGNSDTEKWNSKDYNVPNLLILKPLDPEEALDFAVKMGQDRNNKYLQELIGLLPRYPHMIRALFSMMSLCNSTPEQFLSSITDQSPSVQQEQKDNPEVFMAYIYSRIGFKYLDCKKYNEAIVSYNKSIGLHKKIDENKLIYSFGFDYEQLGDAYYKSKMYNEAIASYQEHVKFLQKAPAYYDFSFFLFKAYKKLGIAYCKANKYDDAVTFLEQALYEYANTLEEGSIEPSYIVEVYNELGDAHTGKKEPNQANEYYALAKAAKLAKPEAND